MRSCVKTSTEVEEEEPMIEEPDFNPWSDPEKLNELLKELISMATKTKEDKDDEVKISPPISLFSAMNTASIVSAAERLGVTTHQYYSSRQEFLGGYKFTRKESLRKRTLKWFKNKLTC